MNGIMISRTAGYPMPMSGATAVSVINQAKPSTFVGPKHAKRERFSAAAAVRLIVRTQTAIADLPCDMSATTSERRT
ncbi:MAG: hypothetical protein GEV28_15105 [Actinophytocola sp.]|uniref:hypothetical protein n=1 Tax=Actinophytocola sp. TaxID=1872138 RepID=UPI00132B3015|nr:hypothetical protein [Actinophytocola sp.]MPZ81649.1 hypothetical protein [Actinophytocola sp.]